MIKFKCIVYSLDDTLKAIEEAKKVGDNSRAWISVQIAGTWVTDDGHTCWFDKPTKVPMNAVTSEHVSVHIDDKLTRVCPRKTNHTPAYANLSGAAPFIIVGLLPRKKKSA